MKKPSLKSRVLQKRVQNRLRNMPGAYRPPKVVPVAPTQQEASVQQPLRS